MTSQRERAAEQTAIRHKLLANGYTPLANDHKVCTLKGWPQIDVTPALIEEWADKQRYQATGVRLDGALTVIDVDIDDADIIDEIVDRLPEGLWVRIGAAPERWGKGAKLAWFVRCEEPFHRYASMAFARPDQDPEGEGVDLHRIEVFGPRAVRQFGAYGAHTMARGRAVVEYRWREEGLVDVPLDELPVVMLDEVDLICRIANEVLAGRGWVRHMRSKSGKGSSGTVYDLTDDMEFDTKDHGTVSLAELEELARGETGVRLSASWLEGAGARNKTRCIAWVDYAGKLQIYETASGDLHKRKEAAPGSGRGDILAALATSSNPGPFDEGGEGNDEASGSDSRAMVQEVADRLLRDFAFCPTEHKSVYPINGGEPRTLALFHEEFLSDSIPLQGPRGGKKRYHPVELWRKSKNRIQIIGERFDPRTSDRVIETPNGLALNLYRPPEHTVNSNPEDIQLWRAFLEHLLPYEKERAWFMMWLAAKAQRPWLPNCTVLMFTETQGTGRGTLFEILSGVFGDEYCSTITPLQLIGDGSQSQYTDWIARALICFCEELMSGEELGLNQGWRRKQAYERLKTLFDPRPRKVQIVQKGRANYQDMAFASFLLASNHANALPLPSTDRRLAVLRNTKVKLAQTPLAAEIDARRTPGGGFTPTFAAAVWAELMAVTVKWADVFDAPMWLEGRAEMIKANETEIDHLLQDVMAQVPGDYIRKADLKQRLTRAAEAAGLLGNSKWWRDAQDILKHENGAGWKVLKSGTRQYLQPKAQGQKQDVIYFRVGGAGEQFFLDAPHSDRPALLSRGNDLNDKVSRAGQALRDGNFGVDDGMLTDE